MTEVLKALSVYFQLGRTARLRNGVRVISSVVLKKISLVVFPAKRLAAVTTVKMNESSALGDLARWL